MLSSQRIIRKPLPPTNMGMRQMNAEIESLLTSLDSQLFKIKSVIREPAVPVDDKGYGIFFSRFLFFIIAFYLCASF